MLALGPVDVTQETCSWQEPFLRQNSFPDTPSAAQKACTAWVVLKEPKMCFRSNQFQPQLQALDHLGHAVRLPNSDARMMPWCVLHERRWRAHTITFWIWSEEQHILWISWTHRNNFTLNITKLRFCIFYPSLVSGTATPILINYYQLISMIYNMNLNIYIKGHRVKRCTKLKSKCNRKGFTGKDWPMWTRTCARNLATNTFI